MSNLSNIQNANNFNNLDGLSVINADEIYIDGQQINLDNYVSYKDATQTVDLGSQNIKTTHVASQPSDLVNLQLLIDSNIYNDSANALTYLNKITSADQTVSGKVSFNKELIVADEKPTNLSSRVIVDANYKTNITSAWPTTTQGFGSISNAGGIYQTTTTNTNTTEPILYMMSITANKRYRIKIGLLVEDSNNDWACMFRQSENGVDGEGVVLQTVLIPSNTIAFQPVEFTFNATITGVVNVYVSTNNPSGVGTLKWKDFYTYEMGVELENVSLPTQTSSKVPIINSKNQLVSSGVDSIKITYLDNCNEDVQTALNSRLKLDGSNANQNIILGTYKVQSSAVPLTGNDYINKTYGDTTYATITSLNAKADKSYVDGQDASLQSQINNKANTSDVNTSLALKANLSGGNTFTGTQNFLDVLTVSDTDVYSSKFIQVGAKGGSNPSTNGIYVYNSKESAGEDAIITVRTAGDEGGDPYISFDVAGVGGWSWGMDSTDNKMKLSYSWSSLTSATKWTINTDGSFGINASPDYMLDVNGTGRVRNSFYIGTEGNASSQIYFGGTPGDTQYNHSVIETRLYNSGGEASELLLFKGNDPTEGGLIADRIRLRASEVCFDTYPAYSTDRESENIRMVIKRDGRAHIYNKLSIASEGDTTARLCVGNPNGTITHFGYSNNNNYIRGATTYIDTTLVLNGYQEVSNGDFSMALYGPNSTWSSNLWIGSGTNKVGSSSVSQLITTNGNVHIDSGYGRDMYFNYYTKQAGQAGNLYFYSNLSGSYFDNWIRITNNNTGIYWENLGYGIISANGEGNNYGNISTHGNGRNGWRGYGLDSRYCFMKSNSSNEWGIHDNSYSWLIRGDGSSARSVWAGGGSCFFTQNYDRFQVFRNGYDYTGGYFYVNQGGGYGYTSDERIKENITPIATEKSIAFIQGIVPSSFNLKAQKPCKRTTVDGKEEDFIPELCNCREDGFIAQNVLLSAKTAGVQKSVIAHWYDYEEEMKKPIEEQKLTSETTLGVNDRPILSHTVNAVKALLEKVETLQHRNQILEDHARAITKELEDYRRSATQDLAEYKKLTEARFEKLTNLFLSLNK